MFRCTCTAVLLALFAVPLQAAEDPALIELARAKAAHLKELTRLRFDLLAAIDAKIKEENDRGAGIDYLLRERKGFEENGVTPILPKLVPASREYLEGKKAVEAKLVKAYTVAIAALSDRGKVSESSVLTKELQQIQGTPAKVAEPGEKIPSEIVGTWLVTFTNQITRTYVIQGDGNISCTEEGKVRRSHLRANGKSVVVEFGDGTLDRLTLVVDGRLMDEHYRPKSDFTLDKPYVVGVGKLSREK